MTLWPSAGPQLQGEEVGKHQQIPMLRLELLPSRLPAPLRCWWFDPVPCQDRSNRAAGDLVPQVSQGTLDVPITSAPILLRHANDQGFDLAPLLGLPGPQLPAPSYFCAMSL